MGQSTNAMLVYGYHLGGDESGWEIEGVGEYGELPDLPWYDPWNDDFQGAAERHLLAAIAGFTETWTPDNEGYFDRERAAEARIGARFAHHCSADYPMYLLVTKEITAYRGDAVPVDFAELAAEVTHMDADAKLRAALGALGITPKQQRAQWLLCSWWG